MPLKKIKREKESQTEINEISNKIAAEYKIQTITSKDSENKNIVRVFFFSKKNDDTNISLTLIVKTDKRSLSIESSNVRQNLIDTLIEDNKYNMKDVVSFEVQMKEIVRCWLRISSIL